MQGGKLLVDGTVGSATTQVSSGATLGGAGSIAGAVTVASGGALLGAAGQTLTMGSLVLNSGAAVDVSLKSPSATGLFDVVGGLTLAGTLNVTDEPGFGPGVYRLFDYGGALTNNGLAIGALPGGDTGQIQTAVANEVNLVVFSGATQFWNGTTTSPTGTVVGGSGTWTAGTPTNWTNPAGSASTAWAEISRSFRARPGPSRSTRRTARFRPPACNSSARDGASPAVP